MDTLRVTDPLNAEWVTALLVLVFIALAWTNISSPRKWRLLAQSMFRMRLGRQTLREEIDLRDRTFLGLLVVSISILALFLWQAFVLVGPAIVPSYPRLMMITAGVLAIQAVLPWMLGGLIQADSGLSEHQATGLLLFILTGMLLLPATVLLAYRSAWREELLWAGFVVLVLSLLYRWIRAAWIGLGEGVPLRYILLYLCAAEMVPVVVLITALRRSILPLSHT